MSRDCSWRVEGAAAILRGAVRAMKTIDSLHPAIPSLELVHELLWAELHGDLEGTSPPNITPETPSLVHGEIVQIWRERTRQG